jgi:predicted kinase
MRELIVTRGLPGCGKTTWARTWVAGDVEHRARVNRDDIRNMLHAGYHGEVTEAAVVAAKHAAIRALLIQGMSVVSDDTYLNPAHLEALQAAVSDLTIKLVIIDMRDVSVATCVERNVWRSGSARLPDGRIEELAQRWGLLPR